MDRRKCGPSDRSKGRRFGCVECNECMKWRGSRIDAKSGMSQLTGHVYSISIDEDEVPGRMLSCCKWA